MALVCSKCRAEVTRLDDRCKCGEPTLTAVTICGGCGEETPRTRMVYSDKNHVLMREECDKCAPASFDPRWKHERGAMGWEAYPEKYIRKEDPNGGWMYIAKDEFRADTEARLASRSSDEVERERRAYEHKRRNRRTTPLTEAEKEQLIRRARELAKERDAMRRAAEANLQIVN